MKCAFDLEADNLLDSATVVWCGVFKDIDTGEVYKFKPNRIQEMLSFMSSCSSLIGHNVIGYDFPLLKKLHGFEYEGTVVDTLLMSRAMFPNLRHPFNMENKRQGVHSLASWGYRVGRGKPEYDSWENYDEGMLHRCTEDVHITELVYKKLLKEGGDSWANAHRLNVSLFKILQLQEESGWLVDREYMHHSISMLTHFIRKIDEALLPILPLVAEKIGVPVAKPFLKSGKLAKISTDWIGISDMCPEVRGVFSRLSYRRLELSKNKETKEFLLRLGWKPEQWNYNSEGERTSPKLGKTDPFEGMDGGMGRLIVKRVQSVHRKAMLEGLLGLVRDNGTIGAAVAGIAATGRLKHRGVVNIPGGGSFFGKQIRKSFVSKEGWKIVGCDAASCQLRMLASVMGDDSYIDAVVNGDIHTVNQQAAGLPTRSLAKVFIYATLFGAGASKIGSIIGGGSTEGKALRDRFLDNLPALKSLLDRLNNEWRGNARKKKVVTPWGAEKWEHFDGWVGGIDGHPIHIQSEHQVLVYVLQSMEATLMNSAYVMLYKRALARGWVWGTHWTYVAYIHDEFQATVREDIADEFGKLAAQTITDAGAFYRLACRQDGDYKIGDDWWMTH